MATFVLLPGAHCGGWSWKKLTPFLCDAGHQVYRPTPTGLGERVHLAHPQITLETHITDIVNVLTFEDLQEVVLVGWSYGGLVITGVAGRVPQRVAQLIYLDATVPDDGQSYYDAWPDGEEEWASDHQKATLAGTPEFVPVPADYIQGAVRDVRDREWMLAKMVAHPLATMTQPVRIEDPATGQIPRSYIRCTEKRDPIVPAFLMRARSDPGWRYRELAANHVAPVTAPQETAALLLSLV